MLSQSSNQVSPSIRKPILLILCLVDAIPWKNFMFLSPPFSHLTLDLCFHLISSFLIFLANCSFRSSLLFSSSTHKMENSSLLSRHWSSSRIEALAAQTSPKVTLTHSFIFPFSLLSFIDSLKPAHPSTWKLSHHSLIKPVNWFSSNHISSNRKGEEPHPSQFESRMRGQWSYVGFERASWETPGNNWSHSLDTRNLSRRDRLGGLWWLDHVKLAPPSGRSTRALELIQSKKAYISEEVRTPPALSEGKRMTFQSPHIHHGTRHLFRIESNSLQKLSRSPLSFGP